ncbi:transposase, partial [Pseudomarimonas arenosa]
DGIYCQRGEMENRIKEQQLGLFADRTSCSAWWPNQFRLLLASLAYTLMQAIRRLGLTGTELARAQCTTIRLKLFKIGGTLLRSVRRIRVLLASHCPYRDLFFLAAQRLRPAPSG